MYPNEKSLQKLFQKYKPASAIETIIWCTLVSFSIYGRKRKVCFYKYWLQFLLCYEKEIVAKLYAKCSSKFFFSSYYKPPFNKDKKLSTIFFFYCRFWKGKMLSLKILCRVIKLHLVEMQDDKKFSTSHAKFFQLSIWLTLLRLIKWPFCDPPTGCS